MFLKHTEQEVRDHITRYGIGRASEDVKAVAREMTAEEVFGIGAAKNADIPNAEWWFAETCNITRIRIAWMWGL